MSVLYNADRLRPHLPANNWTSLEHLANKSFTVTTQWSYVKAPNSSARDENDVLYITDAKVCKENIVNFRVRQNR
jgi:hypothetical protein